MRNPDRMQRCAPTSSTTTSRKVAPLGLKAQVVAYDRELCVAYYDEITRLLEHAGGRRRGRGRHDHRTTRTSRRTGASRFEIDTRAGSSIKARFRDPGDPLQFLIVTAKLLTGFDAGIEGVMYLDKPLRLHTLFQAICRTNRRWTNPVTGQEKLYGLIVDYVGLGNEIARCLRDADPERRRAAARRRRRPRRGVRGRAGVGPRAVRGHRPNRLQLRCADGRPGPDRQR